MKYDIVKMQKCKMVVINFQSKTQIISWNGLWVYVTATLHKSIMLIIMKKVSLYRKCIRTFIIWLTNELICQWIPGPHHTVLNGRCFPRWSQCLQHRMLSRGQVKTVGRVSGKVKARPCNRNLSWQFFTWVKWEMQKHCSKVSFFTF